METSIIIFIACSGAFFTGILYALTKKKNSSQLPTISLADITVIIPFRNEEKRIGPLLNSINQSTQLPSTFIFVNDHSDDNSVEFIKNTLIIDNFSIIHSQKVGKKNALFEGIYSSSTHFILTLDADVSFQNNYFEAIEQLENVDMQILPVKMSGKGIFTLATLDTYFINALNQIVALIYRPIVASGANLLFKREEYLIHNQLDQHHHIASGDDQFLLANFNQSKKNVQITTINSLAVATEAPKNFNEWMHQRLRWIKKTPAVNDSFATTIGFLQLFYSFLFLTLFVLAIFFKLYFWIMVLIGCKVAISILICYPYLKTLNELKLLLFLPIYELIFPFYSIFLLIMSVLYQPIWKGRKIASN